MTDRTQAHSAPPIRRPRPSLRALDLGIAAAVGLLSVLVLVPVDGLMPGAALDLSWRYALADDVARRLPFGRDVVFTFGPLASVYTQFFLPDQRWAAVALRAVLVLAFSFAAVGLARRRLRWAALLLPALLADLMLVDPFFLVAPWVIVPLAAAPWRDDRGGRRQAMGLAALAAVLGPLVLVKGTLAVPVAAAVGAAALAAARRGWRAALALPCAAAGSALAAWVAAGQRLGDLPYHVRRQACVASGYTDAMSVTGEPREIWIYLAGAAALLAALALPRRRGGRSTFWPGLAAAAILFVAFKAGFVRHDAHATIAGGTLALLGLLVFLWRGDLVSGVGLAAGLAASLLIAADYRPVDPASSWARVAGAVAGGADAFRRAARDPDAFRRDFERAEAAVAAAAALPPTAGAVDLYPDEQGLLLAAGRDYDPRPVIQSYSAYAPELAFLDAEHLAGPRAPGTAFFRTAPIDGRYPALEDGPSWPALLGRYRFRAFAGDYAVLDRVDGAGAGTVDAPSAAGTPRFGEDVAVPADMPLVWARMQFRPTLLGRLASALFKLPLIRMDVTTADGQVRSFRLVAGMASAGFLLSPTVATAHDFVALRSTAADALAGQRVVSIRLREDGPGRGLGLWGERYAFAFAALRAPADPSVDDAVLGHLEDGPPADALPTSGECVIDTVGGASAAAPAEPIAVAGSSVAVTGWGLVAAGPTGHAGGNLRIALTRPEGATAYAGAQRGPRPDVDAHFHLTAPTEAGFTAQVNLSGVDGPATLRVVQDGPAGPAACGAPVAILRERPS